MQEHVKNYFKETGYDRSSVIICERCRKNVAVDIHHIEPRSKFGTKTKHLRDASENLIALCRKCHNNAHEKNIKDELKMYVKLRMLKPEKLNIVY